MPNSLRAQITHLKAKGKITHNEYDWFMQKAHGHDKKLIENTIAQCAEIFTRHIACGYKCPIQCERGTEGKCKEHWRQYLTEQIGEVRE